MQGTCSITNKPGKIITIIVVTEAGRKIPIKIAEEISTQENIYFGQLLSEIQFQDLINEYNPEIWDYEEDLLDFEL